jgi:RNA polymerase sigma factor (sigma-70 family)
VIDGTDLQLLRTYAESRSEAAFAELVRRHVDFVYSAALRMVCDSHLAKDVTQGVFVALAKNSGRVRDRPVLSGWLHRTAQNIAAQTVRTIERRRAREKEATAMNQLLSAESDATWEAISPHLDAALGEMSEPDRDALLLRYFERKSAREMAATLGISDEAAQKRVTRAVERLREFFAKRGVTVGASGLAVVISANAVEAAPVGLAVTISGAAALAGTAIATTTTATVTQAIAMTTLQKLLIAATLTVAVGAGIYKARQTSTLRSQVQTLQQHQAPLAAQIQQLQAERDDAVNRLAMLATGLTPRLPAPRIQLAASPAVNLSSPNLSERLKDKPTKLTANQIEPYLKANRRNASSLLAAYRTSSEPALLMEAMQNYPNDPQVAFEAALAKDASPDQRQQWVDALKKCSPDNALPNYLSALDRFRLGQGDQAVQELIAASGKQQFQDYSLTRVQDDEEAYLSAGYSPAEAKTLASSQLLLPQLAELKQLSQDMIALANSYRQSGDPASAQAALQMTVNLGRRFDGAPGEPLISQLVGLAIERDAFNSIDPSTPYGSGDRTVQDRLNELVRQTTGLRELDQQFNTVQPRMSDSDWINYVDRWRLFGEVAAAQWAVGKHRQR